MGILVTSINGINNLLNLYEYNCLAISDITNLPTGAKTGTDIYGNVLDKCAIGSMAYVSGTKALPINKTYKLNASNEWVELIPYTIDAWSTLTLTNGTTGTLKYRKNPFGVVEFTGSVTTTGANIVIGTLPTGYLPTINLNIALVATDGEVVVGTIATSGAITIVGTAGKTYNFNTIAFVI